MTPPLKENALRSLAAVTLAASLLLCVAGMLTAIADWHIKATSNYGTAYGDLFLAPALLAFSVVGWLVLRRHPTHVVGWLLTGGGLAVELLGTSDEYQRFAGAHTGIGGTAVAGAVNDRAAVVFAATVLVALPLLFPDGSPLSRRWRLVGWATAAAAFAGLIAPVASLAFIPCAVAALGSVVLRYLRGGPLERLQLRWVLAAIVLTVLSFASVAVGGHALSRPTPLWFRLVADVSGTFFALIPVAIGIAILRYRLYEIDRLVSRTVSYAVITGTLVAVYVGLVTGVSTIRGKGDPLVVAASTLVVAALFQPLRRRVQAGVDRRFNRARYDAERTVEAFSRRLRSEVDLATVRADLLDVIRATLQPESAELWLREAPAGRR